MIHLYYFKDPETCDCRHLLQSQDEALAMVAHDAPALYGMTADLIDIQLARLVDGEVVRGELVITVEQKWAEVRDRRKGLLMSSDWTDTASAPGRLGEELYQQWQSYRQALRDITEQPDPFNITWPTPPTT